MRKILIVLMLCLFTSAYAAGEGAKEYVLNTTPDERATSLTTRMAELLSFNEAQESEVYAINLSTAEKVQQIVESDTRKFKKKRQVLKKLFKEKDESLRSILSDEQYAEFQQVKDELKPEK